MQHTYLETRHLPSQPTTTIAADIARHLKTRQNLGKVMVICESPQSLLSAVRKQWLKSARQLQRLRASTLNAEEILRLTHAVMHMHNMHFTTKHVADAPTAAVFFMKPDIFTMAPLNCYTVYFASPINQPALQAIISALPEYSLVVDYIGHNLPANLALSPKEDLERTVLEHWQTLTEFLQTHNVDPYSLVVSGNLQLDAMDKALDTLLGVSRGFLQRAIEFQQAIALAQPFTNVTSAQQKTFAAVTRLAHRVQSLTPESFTGYLNINFNDNVPRNMYFLSDAGSELYNDLELAEAAALKSQR